jgi:hypothetical protein
LWADCGLAENGKWTNFEITTYGVSENGRMGGFEIGRLGGLGLHLSASVANERGVQSAFCRKEAHR